MAASRTGTSSIIHYSRRICKVAAVYGAYDLAARTSPEFQAAVNALMAACRAFEALDDKPAEIDNTAPYGPEDLTP